MNAIETYSEYMALKLYMKGKFDYFKYNGKFPVHKFNFQSNKIKYKCEKLSRKHKNIREFILANFVYDNGRNWIGELEGEESESFYRKWCKYKEGLNYYFKEDLDKLYPLPKTVNKIISGLPKPIHYYYKKEIEFQTLVLLESGLKISKSWNNIDHPLYLETKDKLDMLLPLIDIYLKVPKSIIYDHLTQYKLEKSGDS